MSDKWESKVLKILQRLPLSEQVELAKSIQPLLENERRLDEAVFAIADLVHRLGGDVTIDFTHGRKITEEYEMLTIHSSEQRESVRMVLKARGKL